MNSPSHSVQGEGLVDDPKRAGHAKSWVIVELLAGIMVGSYVCEHVLKLNIAATYFPQKLRRTPFGWPQLCSQKQST